MNRDLIIVNSDVGSEQGNKFIQELNNKKINDGKILTFTRKNIGLSYGAYSDAFLKFREFYDFFYSSKMIYNRKTRLSENWF